MKFVFAFVLVAALFACAAASESDFALLPLITSWALKKYGKKKDAVQSEKIDWSRYKKYLTPENLQKAVDIWKILKQKDSTESDAEFLKKIKKWWDTKGKGLFEKGKNLFNKGKEIYAILKNKQPKAEEPQPESDAEFGKFLKKVGGIAKKGFSIYQKAKGLGFFADRSINWEGVKKYATKENLAKAISIYKKLKGLKKQKKQEQPESDFLGSIGLGLKAFKLLKGLKKNKKQKKQQEQPESDAEFLKKLGNWWNTKGKGLFEKGKNLFNKGKEIYAILKNKSESDAEFGKFLKKVGGIAKKGFSIYQKAKGLGFFSDAEADMQFRDQLVAKLKDRVKDKLQKQLKEGNIGKKVCTLTKLRAKPFCASRAKVEADKINFKGLFTQKNLEKAIGIYKAIKGTDAEEEQDFSEADAEFFSKLKTWWNNKGKGLFEKGKNLFNKGKEIYAILKNKQE